MIDQINAMSEALEATESERAHHAMTAGCLRTDLEYANAEIAKLKAAFNDAANAAVESSGIAGEACIRAAARDAEIARLREIVNYVDSWISNPVSAYSVYALDGLFSSAREKIAALEASHDEK